MDGFKAREGVSGLQAVRSSLLTSTTDDELSSTPSRTAETSPPVSMSMEWTDEKHSLYLKSMETSFVNELYDSMELLGWCPENKHLSKSSRPTRLNTFASPAQFKVLRSGCWQKIDLNCAESLPIKTDVTNNSTLLSNPWILHFKSARKTQGGVEDHTHTATEHVASVSRGNGHSDRKKAQSRSGSCSSKHFRFGGHSNFFGQDLHSTDTEVSDQNFVDEDNEGEKAKRVKTHERDSSPSASDQVVPLRKP